MDMFDGTRTLAVCKTTTLAPAQTRYAREQSVMRNKSSLVLIEHGGSPNRKGSRMSAI